jgi:hypothetical protein
MLNRFCAIVLVALVSACTPAPAPHSGNPADAAGLPADCALSVSRPIAFTDAGGGDTIEARTLPAASCDQTVMVVSLRARDGRLLYAFAAPYGQMTQADPTRGMRAVLDAWVQARVDDTGAAPAWTGAGDAFPAAFGQNGGSPFMREIYEGIRADKRPRLCLATSYEAFQCLYYEAESGQVGVLFTASP